MPAQALMATRGAHVLAGPEVPIESQLTQRQKQQLTELVSHKQDVLSTRPWRTHIVGPRHCDGALYRIPEAQRRAIQDEVSEMLWQGIIEESKSAWSNPNVLVLKPNGT